MDESPPNGAYMMENLLGFCCFASDNDMEPDIRKNCEEFAAKPHTAAELWDFLMYISRIQCDRTEINGIRVCVGYISGFVQVACDVSKLMKRPEDGGEKQSTPKEVLDRWRR
jgi:hypothetical protein